MAYAGPLYGNKILNTEDPTLVDWSQGSWMLRDNTVDATLEIYLSCIDSNGIDYTAWANANNGTTLLNPLNSFYIILHGSTSTSSPTTDLRQGDLTLTAYTNYFTLITTDITRPTGNPDYLDVDVLEILFFQRLASQADNATFDNTDWPLKVNPIDNEVILLGGRINPPSIKVATIVGGTSGEGDTRPDSGMIYPRGLDS